MLLVKHKPPLNEMHSSLLTLKCRHCFVAKTCSTLLFFFFFLIHNSAFLVDYSAAHAVYIHCSQRQEIKSITPLHLLDFHSTATSTQSEKSPRDPFCMPSRANMFPPRPQMKPVLFIKLNFTDLPQWGFTVCTALNTLCPQSLK